MMNLESWTYEDFLTYLYLHAMQADFVVAEEEKTFVIEKVGQSEFDKVSKVFAKHSDYEKAQSIAKLSSQFCPSQEQKAALLEDLQSLFMIDSEFNDVEKAYFMALKKLL